MRVKDEGEGKRGSATYLALVVLLVRFTKRIDVFVEEFLCLVVHRPPRKLDHFRQQGHGATAQMLVGGPVGLLQLRRDSTRARHYMHGKGRALCLAIDAGQGDGDGVSLAEPQSAGAQKKRTTFLVGLDWRESCTAHL